MSIGSILKSPQHQKIILPCLVGIFWIIAVVLLMTHDVTFVNRIDSGIYDLFLRDFADDDISPVPAVIDIDEKSLREFGQWPWPRYRLAELFIALYEYGVASIGVDILMTEEDRTSPELLTRQLAEDFDISPEISGIPPELMNNDDYMASIMSQIPIVISAQLTDNPEDVPASPLRPFSINPYKESADALSLSEYIPSSKGIIMPLPQFAESASAIALMNAESDPDSIFRRLPLFAAYKDEPIASLALATLAIGAGDRGIVVRIDDHGPRWVTVAGVDVPISYNGTMPVTFRGGGGVYPYFSAADVINGLVEPEELAGRVVFVGSTTAGLKDLRSTPFDKNYPGLELHAAAVDTILSKRFILEPLWVLYLQVFLIIVLGLVATLLFSIARPQIAFAAGAAIVASVWFGCRYAMIHGGIYVSPLYQLFVVVVQAFTAFSLRFWLEEGEKRVLRKAFSNYVSPEIVGQIVNSGSVSSLQGEQRNISVLFTDLRGFTSLTEKMAPTEVVNMLGSYFSPMTVIVRDSMGTLDKFVGDALMAFWNAPLDVPEHPAKAVRSLLDMHRALEELNAEVEPKYGLRLRMGGGIHTGMAHVGNMGTAELMDYTAIGDTVNTASRLEGMCSKYGVNSVISRDTADGCGGAFALKSLDIVRVKGRREGIPIFTVLDDEEAERRKEELGAWERAFALYVEGDFTSANSICRELTRQYPEEKLYEIFVERTADMARQVPDNWDGVFTYESK